MLRTYEPAEDGGSFGWYVAELDDLDGDGERDLVVGGPSAVEVEHGRVGCAWVFSAASGKELDHWKDTDFRGGFGGVVGRDRRRGRGSSRRLRDRRTRHRGPDAHPAGRVRIYSGATGKEIRRFTGTQPGELFGRMLVDVGDLDRDGVADLAIGAPASARQGSRRPPRAALRPHGGGADAALRRQAKRVVRFGVRRA